MDYKIVFSKYLPVFHVKQRDWLQGVQEPVCHLGQVSIPHFWMVVGCLDKVPSPSSTVSPASSHRAASTDLVTLFSRTIHWAALTWKPLPPHVWEHLDQGVTSHSNLSCSAFPFNCIIWLIIKNFKHERIINFLCYVFFLNGWNRAF